MKKNGEGEKIRLESEKNGEGEKIPMGKKVDRADAYHMGREYERLWMGKEKWGDGEGVMGLALVGKKPKVGLVRPDNGNTVKSYVAILQEGSESKGVVIEGVKQVSMLIRTYRSKPKDLSWARDGVVVTVLNG